jgi:hypothetical protein
MRTVQRLERDQSGQALLLGLMIIAVGALLMLMLMRTGTLLSARERLAGTADAAAYSAGIWRARVLNSLAYANRTIVAQEVAIAQAVTLAAWARHFETLSGSAELLAAAYPPAAAVLTAIGQTASTAAELSGRASELEVMARGAPGLGLADMLETSQVLLLRSANTFGLSAVANEVARATDRRISAFALSDQGEFAGFVRRQTGDDDRRRFRDVVLASLDPFTGGDRDRDVRLPLPSGCIGRSTQLDQWTLWYRKRGSTRLSDDLGSWEALDTGSIHDWRGTGFLGLGPCRDREAMPAGWGMASASSPSAEGSPDIDHPAAAVNPAATRWARASAQSSSSGMTYRGLSTIHDLADRDTPRPTSRVAVLARLSLQPSALDRSLVRTVGQAGPDIRSDENRRLQALAAAEVYFRPPPPAQRIEFASLYSPFWQVRLVAPTDRERQEAQTHAE